MSPNLTQPTAEAASPSLPINMVLTDSNKSLEVTGEVLAGLLVTPVKLEVPVLPNPGSDAVPGSCKEAAPASATRQAEAEHQNLFSRPGGVLEGSNLTAKGMEAEVNSGASAAEQEANEGNPSHTEATREGTGGGAGTAEQRNQRVGAAVRGALCDLQLPVTQRQGEFWHLLTRRCVLASFDDPTHAWLASLPATNYTQPDSHTAALRGAGGHPAFAPSHPHTDAIPTLLHGVPSPCHTDLAAAGMLCRCWRSILSQARQHIRGLHQGHVGC